MLYLLKIVTLEVLSHMSFVAVYTGHQLILKLIIIVIVNLKNNKSDVVERGILT